MTTPDYRFKFEIADETTGEIVIADWLTLGTEGIDQFGGCEAVDHAVARMMRMFKATAREKYERDLRDAAEMMSAAPKDVPRTPEEGTARLLDYVMFGTPMFPKESA